MKRIIDYLKEDLGIDAPTAATLVVTIGTFLLGLVFTIIIQWGISYLKKRSYRGASRVFIKAFFEIANKRVSDLEKIQNQKFFSTPVTTFTFSNYAASHFSSIDRTEFTLNFNGRTNKQRAKIISEFFKNIEFARVVEDTYGRSMSKLEHRFEHFQELYLENLTGLRQTFDNFIEMYYDNKIEQDREAPFIKAYMKIFKDWQDNGGLSQPLETTQRIVAPVGELCRSTLPGPVSRKPMEFVMQCEVALQNIDNINMVMSETIGGVVNDFQSISESGITIIRELKVKL